MYILLKLLFDICLFKKGPQDLPYSDWLLRMLILAYAGIRFLMLAMHLTWTIVLLQILVEICLMIGFAALMLTYVNKMKRFNQVSSALFGTDTLINFLAIPTILTLEIGQGGWLVFMLMLALIAWQCAVIAHIIYNALEQNMVISFALAFVYLMASYLVIALLFPEAASTGSA
jgi:hypothetical protein